MACENHNTSEISYLYKGLEPYRETDSVIFCGRDEDRDRLVHRLQSSRLTILYGGRQVGKTSLLRAGVEPYLQNLCKRSKVNSTSDTRELAWVVFNDWSNDDVVERLSAVIDHEMEELGVSRMDKIDSKSSLVERCKSWTQCLGDDEGELFIILDQFEEYLLRNPVKNVNIFDAELTSILTTRGLTVNVLISIRDDFLASLDRYRNKITDLYDSTLRLEPLTKEMSRQAILNPISYHNSKVPPENQISIENGEDLVDAVLKVLPCEQILGMVDSGNGSEGTYSPSGIQLIMKYLLEDDAKSSKKLIGDNLKNGQQAFRNAGKYYLDVVCCHFTAKEKNLTAKVLEILLTHGGLGLPFSLADFANRLNAEEGDVSAVMEKLSQIGLLTVIPLRSERPLSYYEVKQRILTDAIVDKIRECRERSSKEELKLATRIQEAKQQFKNESQLSALQNAIAATDEYLQATGTLTIPDILKGKFCNILQYMLDNQYQKAQLGGYKGAVSSIVFAGNGERLVTGEENGTLKCWDLGAGEAPPHVLENCHKTWIWAMEASCDGRWLATGSDDGTVSVLTMEGRSPCYDYMILPKDFKEKKTYYPVRGLSFCPSTPILAIADNSGEIRLWDLEAKVLIRDFRVNQDQNVETPPARCVEFSPDGACLATGSDDGVVRLWNLHGELLGEAKGDREHRAEIWSLSFHPEGQYLASASQDRTIKIWNIQEKSKPVFHETIVGHTCCVLSVEFSPDGDLIASASEDGTACLWDFDGNNLAEFTHGGPVNDVAFSPNGDYLATAASDFRARLWDVEKGKCERHSEQFRHPGMAILLDVAVSPDGQHLVTGGTDKKAQLWNKDGKLMHEFEGHKDYILSVAFAPDGKTFATCGLDKTARVWSLDKYEALAELSHKELVFSVAYSPNDGELIATGASDGKIHLWDWRNQPGQPCQSYSCEHEHGPVWSVLFNPRDKSLACGYQDGTIKRWSQKGERINKLSGLHEAPVLSLSFNKEGTLLASGSSGGRICLWDWGGGNGRVLKRFHAPVWSVAFSPDGKSLATGSLDRSVCIFNVESREKIASFYGDAPVRGIGFGGEPGDEWVAAACSDGTIKLWHLEKQDLKSLLEKARSTFDECDILGESDK